MLQTPPGTLIKTYRQDRKWSVRRLARESGFSAGYISQLEKGQRPVTPRAMGRIADALGIRTYHLLSLGGFIAEGHLKEAQDMARCALRVPSIADRARGTTQDEVLDWLVVDYLYLLGDDPYGTGWNYGPGGHEADWSPLSPERMAEADANPRTAEIRQLRLPERRRPVRPAPCAIEGWDELSPADQAFIQQMVNKLRNPGSGD